MCAALNVKCGCDYRCRGSFATSKITVSPRSPHAALLCVALSTNVPIVLASKQLEISLFLICPPMAIRPKAIILTHCLFRGRDNVKRRPAAKWTDRKKRLHCNSNRRSIFPVDEDFETGDGEKRRRKNTRKLPSKSSMRFHALICSMHCESCLKQNEASKVFTSAHLSGNGAGG